MSVKFGFRTSFVAVLLAGVVLGGVGSDVVSTEASAASVGLSVSGVAVAPRVVSAVAGDGFAQVTIADMSPDTGVYAVQWVPVGQSFNSFSMYRTTSKTMTVPYLACTRSYTLRVFVMQASWLLADGHQTQNVTPHSQTFDLTMPACVNAATGVTALTCATGGTCDVGDTGPGGGKVFYVRAGGGTFTSTGSDCGTTCKYLEAAPTDQSAAIVWATAALFCYQAGSDVGASNCQTNSIYSNGAGQAASRTAALAIGMGMSNTNQVHARLTTAGGEATNTYAAGIAFAFTNNGKTDWHLPSNDELNQMCKWQRGVAWTSDATVCTGGTLNSGRGASGFTADNYFGSSEIDNGVAGVNLASFQSFNNGFLGGGNKSDPGFVRVVRAFG
jgi:hypothetical protein